MNGILFDPEAEVNDLFGYGQEMDYYSEDVNDYYDEDIEEGEDDAEEDYYSEEPEAVVRDHRAARATRGRYVYGRRYPPVPRSQPSYGRRYPPVPRSQPRYVYGQRYPRVPLYQQRPPSGFPPTSMEPGDFPQMPMEPGDFPQMPMEPGYTEPDMFDDSAELAETLREVLHENYQDATPEKMQNALFNIWETMTPAEGLNFGNVLGQITKAGQKVLRDPAVGQVAGTVLPAAGGALGTFVGGPVGTAVGGKLGQAAGQAFSGGRGPGNATPGPAKVAGTSTGNATSMAGAATGSATPAAGASPQGGSAAALQLLQLTQNPEVLKSLMALALGELGKQTIEVGKGGPSVPVGAIPNLIEKLASEAAADADELLRKTDDASAYLLDSEGEFLGDPAVPEDRAQVLYEALLGAENQRLAAEAGPQPWSDFFPFAKGAKLLVEYETRIHNFNIGIATVLERNSNRLCIKLHIDNWDRFNVPQTDAVIAIEFRNEGAGNLANIVVDGRKFTDNNVTITSRGNTREISTSISILGQKVDRIAVTQESLNEAKLKLKAGGEEHVLVLTRK